MKCPHCSFDNLNDAPFCEKCGHVFLSSDRVPEVPDPADLSRRRDTALEGVPPIVQVPSIAPADSTGVIRERPSVPEVAPSATGPQGRSSVADLVEPLPEPPREPDFSGFERLVDSSYVPPAAAAGDTAEIPVIHDEYVPHARNYTLGLTPREQRKRDREQRKLEKKFAKAQRKEEARAAKEAAREEARASREAARAAATSHGDEAVKEEEVVQTVAETADVSAALPSAPAAAGTPDRSGALSLAAPHDAEATRESTSAPALPDATIALPPDDLAGVLMTGDGVVSLFEKSSRRHTARTGKDGALELPGAEQGIVVAGERGIESARSAEASAPADTTSDALAVTSESALEERAPETGNVFECPVENPQTPPETQAPAAASSTGATSSKTAEAPASEAPSRAADDAKAAKASSQRASRDAKARGTAASNAPRPKRSKTPVIIAAAAALIVALLLVAGGTYMAEIWGGKTVPGVVGMNRDAAIAALESEAFSVEATEVKSDEAAGTVLSESPNGGARIEEGSTVTLEIATPRVIPDVKGTTRDEAADALAAEGFTAVEYKEKKSNKAEGTVLKVSPKAGTEALSTEPITVTVAVPFTVPDVAGMDTDAAKEALADEGYEVTTLWSYTEDTPEGTALYTDPEAGTQLDSGSDVTLYIAKSRGNELVALAESFLPGARLKNNDGRFIIDSVSSVTYAGDDVVRYTCEAHQYEDVELPFGKGTTRVEDDKRVTLEGSLTFNSDNVVTTADPAIKY